MISLCGDLKEPTSDVCLQKCSPSRLSSSAPSAGGVLSLEYDRVMSGGKDEVTPRRQNGRISYHEDRDVSKLSEEARKMLKLVPIGYVPLPHQVGGHSYFDGQIGAIITIQHCCCYYNIILGMLRKVGQPSMLYKPLQAGSKGPRELAFYESVSHDVTSRDVIRLRQLIPCYYGTTVITDQANTPSILYMVDFQWHTTSIKFYLVWYP